MRKRHEINMTEGSIPKQLLLFFFPLLGSSFLQQLYNTADALIVGRYAGKIALSAVGGPSASILAIFLSFLIAMTNGAAVIVSQFYGSGKDRDVSEISHTSMLFSLILGLLISVSGILLTPWMLELIGTPEDIFADSVLYMRIFFVGLTPSLVYNMASAIFRAVGDSRRPLFFLAVSCFLNIILDLIFVAGMKMGVAGAAIATVICQAVSAAVSVFSLMRTSLSCRIQPALLRIHRDPLLRILRLGIPSGVQSLMYTLSNAIIQAGINSFGTDTVAAWTAYGKIDLFYWMLMSSLGTSIMTFAGQNYGAGKYDRVRQGVRVSAAMTFTLSVVSGILVFLFARPLYRIFISDPAVIDIGAGVMIRYLAPIYFTYCLIEVYTGALRGMGDAVNPLIICGLGICAVRILWVFLVLPRFHSLRILIHSYPVSWVLTSVVFFFYFRRKMRILEGGRMAVVQK